MMNVAVPKRCNLPRKVPLPIFDSTLFEAGILQKNQYVHYILEYDGISVKTDTREDVESLYTLGYFGKGILSLGSPCYGGNICKQNDSCRPTFEPGKDVDFKVSSNLKTFENLSCKYLHDLNSSIVKELCLMLEEAFFLVFALKCSTIIFNNEQLSDHETWKIFQKKQNDFIQRYVAYHHFRSKGWIVKSGLKYGADYTLYKQGPPFYHSSFNVFIVSDLSERDRRMKFFLTSYRVSEVVKKSLLICRVKIPPNLPKDNLDTLQECQVQEYQFTRWVPSENRSQ